MREFPLDTPYTHVVGYVKILAEKIPLVKLCVDQTGVGEAVMEEIRNNVQCSAEGVTLTQPVKADILQGLRMMFEQRKIIIPFGTREPKSAERRLITQITEQQYQLSKTGQIQFSHPVNSHDDMLWSLALAVYATHQGGGSAFIIVPKM
jgi:phage FluMu gp28-like protein